VSLWAAVPHYVSLTPTPGAAKAICDRLAELLEAELDTAELEEAIATYTEQVNEAVSGDPETAAYVEELEERIDAAEQEEARQAEDLPSGDALAEALTQYLREQESGDDEPGPQPH
jgi:predicted ATP-grasp superfamily ATP-dependent carboligase